MARQTWELEVDTRRLHEIERKIDLLTELVLEILVEMRPHYKAPRAFSVSPLS